VFSVILATLAVLYEALVGVYPPMFVPPVTVQVVGLVDEKVRGIGSASSVAAVGSVVN
jgi:hypothetical protein